MFTKRQTSLCSQTFLIITKADYYFTNTDHRKLSCDPALVLCHLHTYCTKERPVIGYERENCNYFQECLTETEHKYMTSKLRNIFRQTFLSVIYMNITLQKTDLPNIFREFGSKARKISKYQQKHSDYACSLLGYYAP